MKLVDKTKGQSPEQEHKAMTRAIGDLIEIMLGYLETSEAVPIFQNVFGADFGKEAQPLVQTQEQLLRTLATQVKEIQYGMRSLVVKSESPIQDSLA